MDPKEINKLDLEGVKSRSAEVDAELTTLENSEAEWTEDGGQSKQHEALSAELGHLATRGKVLAERSKVRAAATNIANTETIAMPEVRIKKTADDAFDLRTLSFASGDNEIRARALTAIERMAEVPDQIRQAASHVVKKLPGAVARRVLLTGSDAYRSAFQKMLVGQGNLLTPAEQEAFRTALSLSDAAGGYAVPFLLDPTIISTKNITTNPFRRLATVKQGVADSWNGVSSAGVTASFDSEAAEVSDDSPTLAGPSVTAHMARAFVRGSIEISMDWAGIEDDLRVLFQEGKDDLEGSKMAVGSGSGEPYGIVTALAGSASEINAAADDTFAIADVYSIETALPPKYRLVTLNGDQTTSRASWVAAHFWYNKIRQFDTGGGAGLLEYLGAGLPPKLLGHPMYEASGMDSSLTTSGAVSNFAMVIGDFRYYVIYDRIGLNIEFIPHLFHTSNNLPSGQRGWFAYWRVGADSVNDDAFRLLDVPSAA